MQSGRRQRGEGNKTQRKARRERRKTNCPTNRPSRRRKVILETSNSAHEHAERKRKAGIEKKDRPLRKAEVWVTKAKGWSNPIHEKRKPCAGSSSAPLGTYSSLRNLERALQKMKNMPAEIGETMCRGKGTSSRKGRASRKKEGE